MYSSVALSLSFKSEFRKMEERDWKTWSLPRHGTVCKMPSHRHLMIPWGRSFYSHYTDEKSNPERPRLNQAHLTTKNVHSGIIHNSQQEETTQMSIEWWMHKQNVVHPYTGILFSHKKRMKYRIMVHHGWILKTRWVKPARHHRPHVVVSHFYEFSRVDGCVETGSRLVFA